MKPFLVLCLAVVFATGYCEYSSDGMESDEKAPWVKAVAKVMKEGMFETEVSWVQNFPMGEEPMKNKLMMSTNNLGTTELGPMKTYFLWKRTDNCSAWSPPAANDENTVEVTFPETPDMNATAAAAGEMMNEVKSKEVDVNTFDLLESQIIVQYDGVNYCASIMIEESEGMNKLELMFSKGIEMDRMNLAKIVSEKLDIDKKYIFIGNAGIEEDCSYAQVFITKKFDDKEMLRKAYMTFKSMSGLGVFSPTEKCQTNVRDSFIVDNILMMFVESEMDKEEEEEPPMTTCAGVSSRLATEYKARLAKYDCIVEQYTKKYGVSMEACQSNNPRDGQYGQNAGDRQSDDRIAPTCNCNSTSGADPEFEMYFVQLMQVLNAPLYNPEISKKQEEVLKILKGSSPDSMKITKITSEITDMKKDLQELQNKGAYGLCIIAGYEDTALEKFQSVKERADRGDDPNEILKDLILESMPWVMEMMKTAEYEKEGLMAKIKLLLKMSDGCSKESERKRVWEMLSNMNESVPAFLTGMAEMMDVEEVTVAINAIKRAVMEDPEKLAAKLFLGIFASVEPERDDEFVMKVEALGMAMKNNSEKIAAKINEWMKDADVDELMIAHILMMPDSELEKGCSLTQLGEQVLASMRDETPSTPCSQSSQSYDERSDSWSRQEQWQERPRYMERDQYPRNNRRGNYNRRQRDEYYNY